MLKQANLWYLSCDGKSPNCSKIFMSLMPKFKLRDFLKHSKWKTLNRIGGDKHLCPNCQKEEKDG